MCMPHSPAKGAIRQPCTGIFQLLPIILLGTCISHISAQKQIVNIMLFYEKSEAAKSFDKAVDFIKATDSLGIEIGEVYKIASSGLDAPKLIQSLCNDFDSAYAQPEGKKPDIIIDFTRHGIPSEAVKMLTRLMTLPTISATFGQEGDIRSWRNLTENQKNYLIQIAPPADMVPQAVRSIVAKQGMRTATLLFDEEYQLYHKYKSLLINMPTKHLLQKIKSSAPNVRDQVTTLVHMDIVNFFIAAKPKQISDVLAAASVAGLKDGPYFSEEFAWYSMSMEPGLPRCNACERGVTVIHLEPKLSDGGKERLKQLNGKGIFKEKKLMDLFYFDLTMNAISTVAKMKKAGTWVAPPPRICKEITDHTDDYKLKLFENLMKPDISKENLLGPFHFDPNKTVGASHSHFQMVLRRLVYEANTAEPHSQVELGTWDTGFGEAELIMSKDREHEWKAHFATRVFKVVTVVQHPFVYKRNECDGDTWYHRDKRCFTGLCVDLLDRMADKMGFNYTIKEVDKYGYMAEEPPHLWDGMMYEMQHRHADIALGAISVMPERELVVDFTEPYYEPVGYSVLMKRIIIETSLFKFLTVLENDVWMCILGAYFFTSFLMWVFDRWSPYSYQNNMEKFEDDDEKRVFDLKECLWFCITSLTPQGGGEAPKNLSGRLVAATWWLFGFIIIASYTANLAAFLTVSRLDAPIESLDDLAKQYKIQYAPSDKSSAWMYFDRMAHVEHRFYEIWKDMSLNDTMDDFERSQLAVWDYPVSDKFTKMWQAMMENTPPPTFQAAIDRVRGINRSIHEGFALVDESTNVRYQVLIACDFKQIGEEFSRQPYAIAVQRGSPLKEAFSQLIRKFASERYLEYLKRAWWEGNALKATCPRDDSLSDGISVHNIGGVFLVIFVGVIMACFTVVFEYWWYRRRVSDDEQDEMDETTWSAPPKELGVQVLSSAKTNFNTQYNRPPPKNLDAIENSW